MTEKIYDIAIIGAGAAGMTAAIYALRAKKSVLIFEEKIPGGQIINTYKIDNYPALPGVSGVDFSKTLKSQVESFGGEFEYSSIKKIEKHKNISNLASSAKTLQNPPLFRLENEENEVFFSKTVILANGSKERELGLKNEKELLGRGISYCATCDGSFYKEKTVAVYGGGNSALYSALYLSNIAKKVYLIIRRDRFRAEPHLVKKLEALKNLEIVKNSVISALNGKKSLKSIEISENPSKNAPKTPLKPSLSLVSAKASSSGPEEKNAQKPQILPLDGLFVSIGRIPDNSRFGNLVKLDKEGYISSDETCKTSTLGVFCAGDTRSKVLHQLVTAISDGAVAATMAVDFLNSEPQG